MSDVITKAVEGSNLIPFSFEGAEVRVLDQAGEPWWVLTDVCKVLEITNAGNASARLDDDEKGIHTVDTLGGPQEMTIINESGLWSLVLTSRKAAAKRFKKWITAEVIPSIRKTGGYTISAPETPEQLAMRALTGLQSVVEKQREQLALTAPKAAALDRISTADGSYGLTEAAKILQIKPKALIAFMATSQWIYRRNGTKNWLAFQAKIDAGYLWHKIGTYTDGNGEEKTRDTVKVLPKGLARLARDIPGASIDPDLMEMEAPPFANKPETTSTRLQKVTERSKPEQPQSFTKRREKIE
ncbi:phage antirepressor KilAC domain-containing protein [Gluconobacter oxydans]|uniref:phage antirepressor KilAC domain-containing protein n=1 Tax=Gluconobacter oxydans TaxID=442 RepID=UPI0009BEB393|nr:phage antirepressor KilAC domain-containing protein [Gluconobacter oxydans]